ASGGSALRTGAVAASCTRDALVGVCDLDVSIIMTMTFAPSRCGGPVAQGGDGAAPRQPGWPSPAGPAAISGLLQQREDVLRDRVGLRQDGGAGLLQDLRLGEGSRLGREVRITDAAARGLEVLGHRL